MNLTLKDLAVIYNALNAQKSNVLVLPTTTRNEEIIKDINSVLKKYEKNEVEQTGIRTEQVVTIEILKDVFWEDFGKVRRVFEKGHVCIATETFIDGVSVGVSAESPRYIGVSDGLNEDEYRILPQKKD